MIGAGCDVAGAVERRVVGATGRGEAGVPDHDEVGAPVRGEQGAPIACRRPAWRCGVAWLAWLAATIAVAIVFGHGPG